MIKKLIITFCYINLITLFYKVDGRNISKFPNIVMMIVDDLGIGDIGCYGNHTLKTPNIDKLATEGVVLHHHLSVAAVCSPSRAAMLTGRYPAKFGFEQGLSGPFVPVHVASRLEFPESETTIAEIFSGSGYRTGIVGKWHLGTGCSLSNRKCPGPLSHGFDYFYGLPFTLTIDMGIEASFFVFDLQDSFYQALLVTFLVTFLPLAIRKQTSLTLFIGLVLLILIGFTWFIYTHFRFHTKKWWQVSPWMTQNFDGVVMRNHEVIHRRIHFDTLFDEIVNESVEFIHSSVREGKPFFLYLSFTHVHIPLFPSVKFRGRSAHGRYGDCIEELDSGVGIIMKALQENHIDEDTIVYFASDHGGYIEAYDSVDGQRVGGYNKEFKGGKAMGAAEGAIRVPGIFRWKGTLSSESTLNLPTSQLDLLPTFIDLADIQLNETISPKYEIDGISFASFLKEPNKPLRTERILLHHCGKEIHALRLIRDTKVYKMYLFRYRWEPGTYHCGVGLEKHCSCYGENVLNISESPILFELLSDPFEDYPIDTKSDEYKNIVSKLQLFLKDYKEKNPYPPSKFESKLDVLLLPWLQPF